jgi:hypothetical protein
MSSAYQPSLAGFPTLSPECNDTERRSLMKINSILAQGGGITPANYVYGISYTIPVGADLLDVSCYNPNDTDQWAFIIISASGPQPGMRPAFPVRVYAHNHAYYEAYVSGQSIPAGDTFSIAVSSAETSLAWGLPIFLAIRHS